MAMLSRYMPSQLRPSGENELIGRCPFHKGGQERKPSFAVNVEKGLFNCFTCHERGTLRQLLKKLNVSDSAIDAETKVLQPFLERQQALFKVEKANLFSNRDPFKADFPLPESILGVYDLCPTKLLADGFRQDVLQKMEVGYDRENNRIMYPLRDMYGNLAGFSGGVTELTKFQHPKYKVYQGKRKGLDGRFIPSDFGEWFDKEQELSGYRCENHDFIWNFHRLFERRMSEPNGRVYVVEGFKACLWMIQSGFENTVALMGSYISERQQQMLHMLGWPVVLFLDNDQAGIKATEEVGDRLWRPMYGRVSVVPYPEEDFDTQPDDYEEAAVQQMVHRATTFIEYRNARRRGHKWQ